MKDWAKKTLASDDYEPAITKSTHYSVKDMGT